MRKKLGYLIGKIFLDRKSKKTPKGKKVLINDCQKIGNYIFKTPLIKGLGEAGYEVYILGSKYTLEMARENPYIKDVIIDNSYRKKSTDIFRNIKTGFKYRNKFDYYIEMVGSIYLREIILMKLLNPGMIIGMKRKFGKILKMIDVVINPQKHIRENGIEVLKYFNIKEPNLNYDIHLNRDHKYSKLIKRKPLVLYNGTASTKSRSVEENVEKRLIEKLRKISWIDFRKIEREKSILDLCGLISQSDLLLTVDTGTSHIGSGFNIPIIIDRCDEQVYPKSSIVWEKDFNDENIDKYVEDILRSLYEIAI
ncbi:glycosyltransferase family 9 protein [Cetobacterium ceti]